MYKRINVGKAIEDKIKEIGISKTAFGNKIGVANQNVNKILARSNIDVNKLMTIGEALDYDFFQLFRPDLSQDIGGEPSDLVKENEELKEKILRLEGENNILRELQGLQDKKSKDVG
jgi:transcriptional regulator with XRE-family HTH domain